MYNIHKNPIGIYEKALPNSFTWEEKFMAAKKAGFDYMEISIDESDERLARLNWTDEEIETFRSVMRFTGISIPTMCLSGHRKYPFGSKDPKIRARAIEIMDTEFVGTIVRAMHYLKEIPSPYFKIYPDMGNLSNFSKDVGGEFELGLSETVAIHVKETKPGIFKEVPFGEGEVRFKEIFWKLKELNYQGMFLIEMWADNSTCQSIEQATKKIAEAYQFVIEKMQEAGMEVLGE